jgi:hypothetical protein
MNLKRGLPEGSPIRQCPGCDEAEPAWLVQIAPGQVVCERCGAIFDPQTGTLEPDPAEDESHDGGNT